MTAPLYLRAVRNHADLTAFLGVAEQFAAGRSNTVMPLRAVRRRRLLFHRPFDESARLTLFIAVRDRRAVGTISVLRDADYDAHKTDNVAFFGHFDVPEHDAEVGPALLYAAEATARDAGASILRGPRDLTRVDPRGAVVGGTSLPPFLANNPYPWLAPILIAAGYQPHHDALAYDTPLRTPTGERRALPAALAERSASLDLPGLTIRQLSWSNVRRDLDAAHVVYTEAFRSVPDNTPMKRGQFRAFGLAFLSFADARLCQLALVNDEPVGFALCFPEANEALRHARGRVSPLALARVRRARHAISTASFKLFGVIPALRGTGLHARLIDHAISGVHQAGYDRLEASLIDSRNQPMRRVVEGAGMGVYLRYRVYERRLDGVF